MHRITFAGEPIGTTCESNSGAAMTRRRAILWAMWKGQRDNGLPDDLSTWSVEIGSDISAAFKVTFTPPTAALGFVKTIVKVPAWQVAEEPIGITIDHEPIETLPPPCQHTESLIDRPAALQAPKPKRKARPRVKPKIVMIMVKGKIHPLRIPPFLS